MTTKAAAPKGLQAMAQREVNGADNFINNVEAIAGCTHAEAVKVFNVYHAAKVLKYDGVNGVYNVKHGAFLDADVITNAINA